MPHSLKEISQEDCERLKYMYIYKTELETKAAAKESSMNQIVWIETNSMNQ